VDVTTIQCGKDTRDKVREYRDEQGYDNYNEALKALLQHVEE